MAHRAQQWGIEMKLQPTLLLLLLAALMLLLVDCGGENQTWNSSTNWSSWPAILEDEWIYVHGLTDLMYDGSQDPATAWDRDKSSTQDSKRKVVEKKRLEAKQTTPDWMRGYAYVLKVPSGYVQSTHDYPVVMFLHGGGATSAGDRNKLTNQFYVPSDDPYILLAPAKIEWDWDATKAMDVIEDVKANLRVDDDRVYLTGLSMGGRGTYIVAAGMPGYFAALMPLSSHHGPSSYIGLAPDVSHLPISISHGDADSVSSYDEAVQMAKALQMEGAYVNFNTISGGVHGGWDRVYKSPTTFDWLLSQKRGTPHNYHLSVANGTGSGYYEAGEVIELVSDALSKGENFTGWATSAGGVVGDVSANMTDFTMPANDAFITSTSY